MRRAVRSPHRTQVDHADAAARARAVPGTWVLVGSYASMQTAQTAVLRIPRAQRIPSYEPAGAFEAYAATTREGPVVWVRSTVGGPYPSLPERMTVRIPAATGPVLGEVGALPVSVRPFCPVCGGPRGWDNVSPAEVSLRNIAVTVDRWVNPCGHEDVYADVLEEALRTAPRTVPGEGRTGGGHHRPNPIAAGPFRLAVELLLQAANEDPGTRAEQGVALLRLHGHQEAARVVEAQLLTNDRLTARQAAQLLTAEGAALRTSPSTSRQEATA